MYAWLQRMGAIALAVASASVARDAAAQSTDGYHSIQVFPLVVETASFTQRFHFRVSQVGSDFADVEVTYYPAQGTSATAPIACPRIIVSAGGETSFESLRALCPGLPPGGAFGTLVARDMSGSYFAASSRVSNPAGAGFAVEAFPANTFTSAWTSVTGLRRLAAHSGTPAFQSNCFIGNLAELGPAGALVTTSVTVKLQDRNGAPLGQTLVDLAPGRLVRLLDVFAATGVPTGDVDDAVATFASDGSTSAGLMTFCTVQENGSFSADFRIGKQEYAWNGAQMSAQDLGAARASFSSEEDPIDNETHGAAFSVPAGASRNIHLFYFRHPDSIGCQLYTPAGVPLTASYGLELRLRVHDASGWQVVAGGNDVVQFGETYLGDKPRHGGGENTTYQLEVESNGQNTGVDRPYMIGCFSGSGHSRGELLRKGLATVF